MIASATIKASITCGLASLTFAPLRPRISSAFRGAFPLLRPDSGLKPAFGQADVSKRDTQGFDRSKKDGVITTKQLADDIYVFEGFPPYAINAYLLGDVLIDAATRFAAGRLLRRLRGRPVSVHALTHAHPDHQGASHAICTELGIPLWCGDADADAMEREGEIMRRIPRHFLTNTVGPWWVGPPHPVSRRLREGDRVGSFTVIETPGHTVGHISFWRADDGVLVLGDVMANLNIYTGRPMLREPERFFSIDPAQNRDSARRLVGLQPRLICFGHGPPMRNSRRFADFVTGLPRP